MNIIRKLHSLAKAADGTIVLPEAHLDNRVLKAAKILLKKELCKLILFGTGEQYPKFISNNPNCTIIDIESSKLKTQLANKLFEIRKDKGLTKEEAKQLILNPIYFGTMLLKTNKADGMVVGAYFSSADALRPALQIIKTKPNANFATCSMLMIKKNFEPYLLSDISLMQKPNAEQLAQIAISNAEFMDKFLHIEPRVAMLSYSTKGSANSDSVKLVQTATKLAKDSQYTIDGEMQFDSAVDRATALRKGVDNKVAGRANVLIFPNLEAGNIGYKIMSRFGGFSAIGPITLNLNKPVNDLSRGCTVDEIVSTVCITKLQAKQ